MVSWLDAAQFELYFDKLYLSHGHIAMHDIPLSALADTCSQLFHNAPPLSIPTFQDPYVRCLSNSRQGIVYRLLLPNETTEKSFWTGWEQDQGGDATRHAHHQERLQSIGQDEQVGSR